MTDSPSSEDPLGRLADEFLTRYRRGERPTVTEYAERHPELAEQVRELFSALVMMEDVRPSAPATGTPPRVEGPERLGEYRIIREIGRGGQGVVYEAEQESLGRRVALKVLPATLHLDSKHILRFQQEARAAARLHHTSIVPVFGVGEENGTHYYVMQYIEGCSLQAVLTELRRTRARQMAPAVSTKVEANAEAGNPLSADLARSIREGSFRSAVDPQIPRTLTPPLGEPPPPPDKGATPAVGPPSGSSLTDPKHPYGKSVAHIGVLVADALEYASGQGVLHRDIKPSNLLLDVWGAVWLTDFGLAKASGTEDLTRTGDLLGTLRYMASERFRGRTDVRSDVYSLGVTLYEMLALRPAFEADGQGQLMHLITSTEARRLDQLVPGLPRDLVTIVHKAMAKDPADRYQTPGCWPTTSAASSMIAPSWRGASVRRSSSGAGAAANRRWPRLWPEWRRPSLPVQSCPCSSLTRRTRTRSATGPPRMSTSPPRRRRRRTRRRRGERWKTSMSPTAARMKKTTTCSALCCGWSGRCKASTAP
jgi:serine/threonine protein kinase